jgi:glycosyltransferase involved in cell wall biosynthesis
MTEGVVSVIVPVYNGGARLHYCLDSIAAQTYNVFEAILVDDGSTDDSGAICDDYAAKDSRFVVIHQKNGGISTAQNAGLNRAHGEYISFSDNDDILSADCLETLVHALEQTGSDIAKGRWAHIGESEVDEVAQTALSAQNNEGETATGFPVLTVFEKPLHAYQTVFPKTLRILGGRKKEAQYFNEANWCKMYRRELWEGIRFPEGKFAQDLMVAGEIYQKAGRVVDVDKVLYYWVQNAQSISHSAKLFAFCHDNFCAGVTNFRFAREQGITPARSYFIMRYSYYLESLAPDFDVNRQGYADDKKTMKEVFGQLGLRQRLVCSCLFRLRSLENVIYDRTLHVKK